MKTRGIFVLIHRYAGLAMAAFLIMAGLTGSIISFNHELDEWLNPELFHAPAGEGEPLSMFELAKRVEEQRPEARVSFMSLEVEPGHTAEFFLQPHQLLTPDGDFTELENNQVFANPYTGEILGQRTWGAFNLDSDHIIPFLYKLHYSLHLPGLWGLVVMGIVSIVWMIDCFIGFYLTLPRGRPFWQKWKPAFKVKTAASTHRINFDLHRASGLWLWPVLFVIAMSSISLNLNEQVFRPVVSVFAELSPSIGDLAMERFGQDHGEPLLTGPDAVARAKEEAAALGITEEASMFWHPGGYGAMLVGFGEDHGTGLGASWLAFDHRSGELLLSQIPGSGTPGDTFIEAQFPLHSGQIIGLPGRIFICVMGIVVAGLSITGVVIWARKRSPRRKRAAKGANTEGFAPQGSPAE